MPPSVPGVGGPVEAGAGGPGARPPLPPAVTPGRPVPVAPAPRRARGDVSLTTRLQSLQELSAALADALTVDDVARVTVRALAGLPGVVRGALALPAAGGRELRFLSLQDEDEVGRGPLSWCVLDATDDLPLAVCVRTGNGLWFPTVTELAGRFPVMAHHQARFGARAFVVVPLPVRGRTLGGLMLCYGEERPFGSAERAFLDALAAQVAQAVHRASAYERQQSNAETLQRALLPDLLPELVGLAMASQYVPGAADVGGDWFDVLPLADGSVLVVIGDVMGRGVAAATVMGQVRAALRAYALLDPDPVLVLSRLDQWVATLGVPEQIVTVLAGVISADRGDVRLACAGHLPPALAVPGGASRLVDVPADPPLGLAVGERAGVSVPLPPGATLVLVTDGLVESAARPVDVGLDQLCALLDSAKGASRLPQDLCARLSAELGAGGGDDDRAVLVVTSTVGRSRRADQLALAADLKAPALRRRWLRDVLSGWGVADEVAGDACMCLSEVVTNAVIHAGTGARVAVELDEARLLMTVVDTGVRGSAQRRELATEEIRGRGLGVVEALATAWSSERRSDGTLVWFEFDLT
jgi:serine phosphatase RsbU (regulator of sigma subunit)/anti-sigma regulatory factor (Ser/Thr protein kinase)